MALGYGTIKIVNDICKFTFGEDYTKRRFTMREILYILQEMEEANKYYDPEMQQQLRGYSVFHQFVKMLFMRNCADFDSMVLITADKGMGKSNAGIMICKEWCSMLGIKYDPARHIAYSNADVMMKLDTLNKFEPILLDEAVRFACIDGDSIVTVDGKPQQIKDVAGKRDFEVSSYNPYTNQYETQIARECVKTNIEEGYEITTSSGRKIIASEKHMFMITKNVYPRNRYKPVSELKVGDRVVVDRLKECSVCGNIFEGKVYNHSTCSKECDHQRKMMWELRNHDKVYEQRHKWYMDHHKDMLEYHKKYRDRGSERQKALERWHKKHVDKFYGIEVCPFCQRPYMKNRVDRLTCADKKCLDKRRHQLKREKYSKTEKYINSKKIYGHKYYVKNKEKLKQSTYQWCKKKGRVKYLFIKRRNYARRKRVINSFTIMQWNDKAAATKGICPRCNMEVGIENMTLDHHPPVCSVKPGFIYTIDMVSPMCRSCNGKKGGRIED